MIDTYLKRDLNLPAHQGRRGDVERGAAVVLPQAGVVAAREQGVQRPVRALEGGRVERRRSYASRSEQITRRTSVDFICNTS